MNSDLLIQPPGAIEGVSLEQAEMLADAGISIIAELLNRPAEMVAKLLDESLFTVLSWYAAIRLQLGDSADGALVGHLVDQQSKQDLVELTVRIGDTSATSDSRGMFALIGLNAGEQRLTVGANGGWRKTVEIVAGQVTPLLVFSVEQASDAEGNGVAEMIWDEVTLTEIENCSDQAADAEAAVTVEAELESSLGDLEQFAKTHGWQQPALFVSEEFTFDLPAKHVIYVTVTRTYYEAEPIDAEPDRADKGGPIGRYRALIEVSADMIDVSPCV